MMNQEKMGGKDEVNPLEGQVVPVQESQENNDPFARGRERILAIAAAIASAKEKAKSMSTAVASKLSKFWSRTKSVAGNSVAAVLSADVLAQRANDKINEKVGQAGEYVGYKAAETAAYVGDKKDQFETFVGSNYDKAKDFKHRKVEAVKNFANEKVELTKDVAYYAKEKTVEGLNTVKNGIENKYNNIKGFCQDSLAYAGKEVARIKSSHREVMNNIRMSRLQAEYARVAQLEGEASDKAQKLRDQRNAIAQKLGLFNDLATAA